MPVDLVRDAAVETLLRVFEKRVHISRAIDRTLQRKEGRMSSRGRRFMGQLVYGTTRHALLADHVLRSHLHQPPDKLPLPILLILRMGVFQALFCDSVTFPAMVHTAVDLAKKHGHAGTARLVNAVLKKVPETLAGVPLPDEAATPLEHLSIRYSVPLWLVERWAGEHSLPVAKELCEASNTQAPWTIRVNTLLTTRDDLIDTLEKAGVACTAHPILPEAAVLVESGAALRSKAFQRGLFFIQDAASMLAPHLLAPEPGNRILDLCAAPGGKTTHLAQLAGGKARIVSSDRQPARLRLVRDNTERMTTPGVALVAADAASPPFQADFDRVLLDAPCSGLGTLRRRPDTKWRIGPEDIRRLAGQQEALLRSAIQLCKNGGLIVYSVCTFTPEETEQIVASVLGDEPVTLENGPEWLNQWKISTGQYRILPQKNDLDGYFLTRLLKG